MQLLWVLPWWQHKAIPRFDMRIHENDDVSNASKSGDLLYEIFICLPSELLQKTIHSVLTLNFIKRVSLLTKLSQ